MRINSEVWKQLKEAIEVELNLDPYISDISINYQIRNVKEKNYLRFNVKTEQ